MKISFDIHGVIDTKPELFVKAISELKKDGHNVIVITGPKLDNPYYTKRNGRFDNVKQELTRHGVYDIVDKVYSILDYHVELGTEMWQTDKGWYIDETEWNKSKGIMCKDLEVDFHIDDTFEYNQYFTTPFGYVDNNDNTLYVYNSNIRLNSIMYSIYRDILNYNIVLK